MFPRISYLEWTRQTGDVEHNLLSTVLGGASPGEDCLFPPELQDLEDPPPDVGLVDILAEEYGMEGAEVAVTSGASHGNILAAMVAGNRTAGHGVSDPEVLVERPGYGPMVDTPEGLGFTVRRFPRHPGSGVDRDRLEEALSPETAMVSLTNRHNPSGHLLEREELRAIAETVTDHGAHLLVDEVYAPYVTRADERPDGAFGGPTAAGLPRTIVTQSVTKFYGYGFARVGWVVADGEFINHLDSMMLHLPTVSSLGRRVARRLLHHSDRFEHRARERLEENTAMLSSLVDGRDDLEGTVAPGSSVAFPAHKRASGDAVAEAALKGGVWVAPGSEFGDDHGFRISLGGPPDQMRRGVEAFETVLDGL